MIEPESSQQLNQKSTFSCSLVFVACTLISILRQYFADPEMFRSIWAEDGWMPLCVVSRGHGACLADQVNGYWPVLHRLISEVLALLPLRTWPYVFPMLGAIMMGAICALVFTVFRSNISLSAGAAVGLGVALIPSLGIEFINVVGNVHWLVLMAAMIMLVANPDSQDLHWKSLSGLVFVASLANPAGLLLSVQIILCHLVGLSRGRKWRNLAGISLSGWVIQLCAILLFDGTGRVGTTSTLGEKLEDWANSLLATIPGLRVSEASEEAFSRPASWLTPAFLLLLVSGLLLFLLINPRTARLHRQLAVLGASTQGLSVFLIFILDENPRYQFVIIALNVVWISGLFMSVFKSRAAFPAAVVALLVLPIPALKASPYRVTHADEDWLEQLETASDLCRQGMNEIEVFFAPGQTYLTKVRCELLVND